MNIEEIKRVQNDLKSLGLYDGVVDGKWGDLSRAAFNSLIELGTLRLEIKVPVSVPAAPTGLAWGACVSPVFRDRIQWTADALDMPKETGASLLMGCIAWESGETFSASVLNKAGSGAVGLIQFMPSTAKALGTTSAALAVMTAEDQVNYVYKYFRPFKGRLKTLGDIYMAILWPAAVGKPDDYVLWEKDKMPTTYRQNAGLDVNGDKAITKAEAVSKVQAKLERGMTTGKIWTGA